MPKKTPNYERELKKLVGALVLAIRALDDAYKMTSTYERGQRFAKIINALEMQIDSVRYFVLGVDHRKDSPALKLAQAQKWVKGSR